MSGRLRVVLCMGQFCNAGGMAEPLYARLRAHLGDPVPAFMARGRAVVWETATCLSYCGGGPNLVIYDDDHPDGLWFHQLDLETLELIIRDYLSG